MEYEHKYLKSRFYDDGGNNSDRTLSAVKAQSECARPWLSSDRPLLVLDVDNTMISVRYFSDEMEIGDLVTYFEDDPQRNYEHNAKVIALRLALTLQITSNEMVDQHGSERIVHRLWVHSESEKQRYLGGRGLSMVRLDEFGECRVTTAAVIGCSIELVQSAENETNDEVTNTVDTANTANTTNVPNRTVTIDFLAANERLQRLEPCLERKGLKRVDFVTEGFLVRIRCSLHFLYF